MTTDHAAEIAAAEAALAAAQADVDRLRAQLAAEHAASTAEPTEPRLMTWEDGVAAAKRRFPGRTRSEQAAAGTGDAEGQAPTLTGAAAGVAAARARGYSKR